MKKAIRTLSNKIGKIFFSATIVLSMITQTVAFASSYDVANYSKYLYKSISFLEGSSDFSGAFVSTTTQDKIGAGWVMPQSDGVIYIAKGDGLPGRTTISFDAVVDQALGKVAFNSINYANQKSLTETFSIEFSSSNNKVEAYLYSGVNRLKIATVFLGEKLHFEIEVNNADNSVSAVIQSELSREKYELSGDFNSLALSTVSFSNTSLYLKNFNVYRDNCYAPGEIPIYKCGDFYITGTQNIESGQSLCLALYNNNCLNDISLSSSSSGKNSETFIYCPALSASQKLKSFLWDNDLSPQVTPDINDILSLDVTTQTATGSLSLSTNDMIITVSASTEENGSKYVEVADADGNIVDSVAKNDISSETFTITNPGWYTVRGYLILSNGYLIPFDSERVFISNDNIIDDTFAFKAYKDYYYRNGQKLYFNLNDRYYFPVVENDEVYMLARHITELTGFDIGNAKSITNEFNTLYSLNDVCEANGYVSSKDNNIVFISKSMQVDFSEYIRTFEDYIFTENFENQTYSQSRDCYGPVGWSFFDWGTSSYPIGSASHGKEESIVYEGNYSAYITCPASSVWGYQTNLDIDTNEISYDISFVAKMSQDANILPVANIQGYKDGAFVKQYSMIKTSEQPLADQWRLYSFSISQNDIKYNDFNMISLIVGAKKADSSAPASGTMYIDDLRLTTEKMFNDICIVPFTSNSLGSMYVLGNNVCYTADEDRLKDFVYIKGTVYDSDGNEIDSITDLAYNIINNGWEYTPTEPGWYEVEFEGTTTDGSNVALVSAYNVLSSTGLENLTNSIYDISRYAFTVSPHSTKAMNERNDLFMLSDSGSREDRINLADAIGFSGIRLHTINWGKTGVRSGFHTGIGAFDWKNTDTQINNVYKYGFKNIIANVCFTPQWAAPNDKASTGTNVVGAYEYNLYAPTSMNYLSEGMTAFANKYKNKITAIEFWNEPYYGKTAFWHDGIQSFKNMAVTASTAIKTAAPNMEVISAGFFKNGYTFLDELLSDSNYTSSFDRISFHGRYGFYDLFKQVIKKHNLSNVPVMDSESYLYATTGKGVLKDQDALNMAMLMTYFYEIKSGIDQAALFEINDNYTSEYYVDFNEVSYGLFNMVNERYEPTKGVAVLRNFIDIVGTDFSYDSEAKIDNQAGVVFNNGSTKLLCVWSTNDSDFVLNNNFASCLTGSSTITDFYGRQANINNLKANTVYFLSNVDISQSADVFTNNSTVLNKMYQYPYYTLEGTEGAASQTRSESIGTLPLFNKNTFIPTAGNKNITNLDWNSLNDRPAGYDAEMNVSVCSDGIYLVVDVKEDSSIVRGTSLNDISSSDSIEFAFADSTGSISDRNQFCVGMINNNTVFYKAFAAKVLDANPDNFSTSGTYLPSNYVDIEYLNNNISYKVFIPFTELYPLAYSDNLSEIKFSLQINNFNTVQQSGYSTKENIGSLCYGNGIDTGSIFDYGELLILGRASQTLSVDVSEFDSPNQLTAVVYRNGRVYNIIQIDDAQNCTTIESPANSGTYTILVTDASGNTIQKTAIIE